MTVGYLRRTMDSGEYLRWGIYYGRKAQKQQMAEREAKWRR